MIIKRISSIIIDLVFLSLPAIIIYITLKRFSMIPDFSILISIIFFIGIAVQIFYTKNKTMGMFINKIEPMNKDGNKSNTMKMLLYYFLFSIFLVPALNHYSSAICMILIMIPLPFFAKPVSIFDLLLGIHWEKAETSKI